MAASPAPGTPTLAAAPASRLGPVAGAPIDEAVVADLLFAREEEKLARDVYLTLLDATGFVIFANISEAEQRHMDAVLGRLNARDIPDPIVDDAVGVFVNPVLAQLYTDLVGIGLQSPLAALTVGATIEDLDLNDLAGMTDRTTARDILRVYEALTCGSRNHMRAFVSQLQAMGASYEAQYITAAELEAILASSHERCGGRR
ncbi:DUF2202 domain-containing protein [bacterium]|nr:DUF2202 domain-containing protein [bacterium]